jgi:hypothetical protein
VFETLGSSFHLKAVWFHSSQLWLSVETDIPGWRALDAWLAVRGVEMTLYHPRLLGFRCIYRMPITGWCQADCWGGTKGISMTSARPRAFHKRPTGAVARSTFS